jgi:hypothetical protein
MLFDPFKVDNNWPIRLIRFKVNYNWFEWFDFFSNDQLKATKLDMLTKSS